MNRLEKLVASGRRSAWVILAACFWLLSSPVAWAAKKKVVEEAPTKSYTLPYLIVIILIGAGLMAICRPSRRADRPEEKLKPDEE